MYTYTWRWSAETEREIGQEDLEFSGRTINDLCAIFKNEAYNKTREGLEDEANKQGLEINILNITVLTSYSTRTFPRVTIPHDPINAYKIQVSVVALFESNEAYINSPINPSLLVVIKWIISAVVSIVVSYFVIEAVKNFCKSLVTKTNTIETEYFDEEGNIIKKVTETIESASLGGMLTFISIVTILGVLILGIPKLNIKIRHKK